MPKSALSHPLAVLRKNYCKISQIELAKLVKCSPATITSVEVGRLPLSENLAQEIAAVTGVDPAWLLRGDPESKPVDPKGWPYTEKNYVDAKNYKKIAKDPFMKHGGETEGEIAFEKFVPRWKKAFARASALNRLNLATFKMEKVLIQLEEDFECSKSKGKSKS